MNTKLFCHTRTVFADQITPISAFLNVRAKFSCSFLLESSEVDDIRNSRSIICAKPIAGIEISNNDIKTFYQNTTLSLPLDPNRSIQNELNDFFNSFEILNKYEGINGFFGFQSFEAIKFFETKKSNLCDKVDPEIAIIDYRLFQYVICFNHFNGEIQFIENVENPQYSTLNNFIQYVLNTKTGTFPFNLQTDEIANITDEEFLNNINKAKHHCKLGDVFQMVLSRRFQRNYIGDEFNVYRALRHINPSPYMFYFDYGAYKLFGSSPESQIRIVDNEAFINPIAGTYKRTGNKEEDEKLSNLLLNDSKESAEHSMLVDLARNDLNRHCTQVQVSEYRSVKQFSHVIHLVSTVKGNVADKKDAIQIMSDTFPAGTLSGAPKIKAIQLLNEIEASPRGYYGGSIGFIDFNGDINQAILIRSFLAKNNTLIYQAGAGVVLNSDPESELKEVDNKLAALRNALIEAENY